MTTAFEGVTAELERRSSTGIRRSGRYVTEEYLSELSGRNGMRVYTEMRRGCPVVGPMMFLVTQLLKSVDWHWEPEDPNNSDDNAARDFLAEEFECVTSWIEMIDNIVTMFPYGYSIAEIVYKKRPDGKLGWKDFYFIKQDTMNGWDFDEFDQPTAFVQLAPLKGVEVKLPLTRCLLFRTSAENNNPEGTSILRNAYMPWYYRNRLQEIQAIGMERNMAGLPVMYIPLANMLPTAGPSEQQFYLHCQEIVRSIRVDENMGVILPSDTWKDSTAKKVELTLLSAAGSQTSDVEAPIQRYDRHIASSMLADFIMLGHEKVGTFSLSDDKTDIFATALGAFLQQIALVFKKQGSDRLLYLNNMKGKAMLTPGDLEKGDITKTIDSLTKLTGGGIIVPDPALEIWSRELIGAPKPDMEFVNADGSRHSGADEEPEVSDRAGGKGDDRRNPRDAKEGDRQVRDR